MPDTRPIRTDAAVIALVGVAHATSHLFHLLLPPLFPLLMPDFGFSYTEAGFLMTVFFTISGIGQALSGFLVDRLGAARVLGGGIGCFFLAAMLLAFADDYAGLMLATPIYAFGYGLELAAPSLEYMKRMLQLQYLGIPFLSLTWLGLSWA